MTVLLGLTKYWYALEPNTYKLLGKAVKLKTLIKKFGGADKILYSKGSYPIKISTS